MSLDKKHIISLSIKHILNHNSFVLKERVENEKYHTRGRQLNR